jgi:hypothetical protein
LTSSAFASISPSDSRRRSAFAGTRALRATRQSNLCVALGFGFSEQFPRLTLYPPHFIKKGFAEALFMLGLGLANRIGDVVFVA